MGEKKLIIRKCIRVTEGDYNVIFAPNMQHCLESLVRYGDAAHMCVEGPTEELDKLLKWAGVNPDDERLTLEPPKYVLDKDLSNMCRPHRHETIVPVVE